MVKLMRRVTAQSKIYVDLDDTDYSFKGEQQLDCKPEQSVVNQLKAEIDEKDKEINQLKRQNALVEKRIAQLSKELKDISSSVRLEMNKHENTIHILREELTKAALENQDLQSKLQLERLKNRPQTLIKQKSVSKSRGHQYSLTDKKEVSLKGRRLTIDMQSSEKKEVNKYTKQEQAA